MQALKYQNMKAVLSSLYAKITSPIQGNSIIETTSNKGSCKYGIVLLLLLFAGLKLNAQNVNKKLGDNYFNHMAYVKAIKSYEKALSKDSSDVHVLRHLAQSYKNSGNYSKAEELYNILMIENDSASMESYARLLVYNNNYNKADSIISTYQLLLSSYQRSFVDTLKNADPKFKVSTTNINTAYADHRPCFYKNDVIFSTARDTTKKEYEWNGQPYLSLYKAIVSDNGSLKNAKPFSPIDSRYHISSFQYVYNRGLAFFTINNASAFSTIKDANNEVNLGIYTSKYTKGTWQKPKPLKNISNGNFSSAHPYFSASEDRLYFSSNRPGGFGGSDIYYVEVYLEGTSEPINCGASVNTEGDEMYPFVSDEGKLYFSSDGHLGLGGLDIFSSDINDDEFGEAINLGVPVNSSRDDFSIVFKEGEPFGYFASNREGGMGDDDIYAVSMLKKQNKQIEENHEEPKDEDVVKLTEDSVEVDNTELIAVNSAAAPLPIVSATAAQTNPIPEEDLTLESLSNILLESKRTGSEINKSQFKEVKLRLYNINFDYNSWEINDEAALELDKLANMMRKNTTMTVELSSHTDSRGNDDYNMVLSQARADAVLKYVLKKGISIYRLTAHGYGEKKLLNHCSDGVSCSEELHKENRRVEALITSY